MHAGAAQKGKAGGGSPPQTDDVARGWPLVQTDALLVQPVKISSPELSVFIGNTIKIGHLLLDQLFFLRTDLRPHRAKNQRNASIFDHRVIDDADFGVYLLVHGAAVTSQVVVIVFMVSGHPIDLLVILAIKWKKGLFMCSSCSGTISPAKIVISPTTSSGLEDIYRLLRSNSTDADPNSIVFSFFEG